MKKRVAIKEAILVEGRYDKITLSQIVDAAILVADGFGIMKDAEKIRLLREIAARQGLVIFTDADGGGLVIRNRLRSVLPSEGVYHAYIPEIPGKEKRKRVPGKAGLLGVEGMEPDTILQALLKSGAHVLDADACDKALGAAITRQDLFRLGLMGGSDSSTLRRGLMKRLGFPQNLGTSSFLDALNCIMDLSQLEQLLADMDHL